MDSIKVNGYKVTAVSIGRNFGYVGLVKHRNGRVAHETAQTYPTAERALEVAASEARSLPAK